VNRYKNEPPILTAAKFGYLEVVRKLVDLKADYAVLMDDGASILHCAAGKYETGLQCSKDLKRSKSQSSVMSFESIFHYQDIQQNSARRQKSTPFSPQKTRALSEKESDGCQGLFLKKELPKSGSVVQIMSESIKRLIDRLEILKMFTIDYPVKLEQDRAQQWPWQSAYDEHIKEYLKAAKNSLQDFDSLKKMYNEIKKYFENTRSPLKI
jgi:hypothetical protein